MSVCDSWKRLNVCNGAKVGQLIKLKLHINVFSRFTLTYSINKIDLLVFKNLCFVSINFIFDGFAIIWLETSLLEALKNLLFEIRILLVISHRWPDIVSEGFRMLLVFYQYTSDRFRQFHLFNCDAV